MDVPPAFSPHPLVVAKSDPHPLVVAKSDPHPLVVAESDPQPVAVGADTVDVSDVAAPQPALVTASVGAAASVVEAPHAEVVLSVVVQS